MQESHVTDLIPAYVIGALEPDEVDAVEQHLATCQQCSAEVRQYARIGGGMLLAAPQSDAPPALRARLLDRVRQLKAEAASDGATSDGATSSASASRVQRPGNPLSRAFRAAFGAGAGDNAEIDRELRALLLDPESAVFAVSGTPDAPAASARLIASPRLSNAVLVANGLTAPGPGRAYQVWFLRDGKPIPNALFDIDRRGQGVSVVRVGGQLRTFDTVAVTPEPAGGSPSPTGPIVLAGALKIA